jgi:protein TonB
VAYEYSIDDPARNQKRTLAFIIVVIIHVLFFWVLASGLGAKIVEVVIAPVQTKIIEDTPDEDKPPPPPPEMDQPPPYVPPPDFAIEAPAATGPTTAITNTTTERPTVAPVPVAKPVEHQVVRTPPSTQGKGARITQAEYPPSSRRAGEAGTVTLTICVSESGRPTDVKVRQSSGFEKLDEAAVKDVQRNWKLVPGKEDGKPVPMCSDFKVTFKLTD